MTAMLLDTQVDTKGLKVFSSDMKDLDQNESGDFFEQMINGLMNSIDNSDENNALIEQLLSLSSQDLQDVDSKEKVFDLLSFKTNDTKSKNLTNIQESKNSDDSKTSEVLLEDLMNLSYFLKNNTNESMDFENSSDFLKNSGIDIDDIDIKKDDFYKDIKGANSVKDLLDIAEKNDIKVKSFDFFMEKSSSSSEQNKLFTDIKSEDVLEIIDKNTKNSTQKLLESIKNSSSHEENTLKNILSEVSINNKKTKSVSLDTKTTPSSKEVFISQENTKDIKVNLQEEKTKEDSLANQIKVENNKNKISEKSDTLVAENMKNISKEAKSDSKINTTAKKHDIKIDKNEKIIYANQVDTSKNNNINLLDDTEDKEIKIEKSENTTEKHHEIKSNEHLSTNKTDVFKDKKTDVKHTLNTFAQDFKEQVESYKPPLMKVKMQLNPQGLGDVDVTMVNRGNNLHITVNSNQNTIAIFSQNQAEFKNSLVNMGFSELNMSFNENGKNKDESQNQKNKNGSNQSFEEETSEDSFEIVTPIYI